jgi:hypothetical protein
MSLKFVLPDKVPPTATGAVAEVLNTSDTMLPAATTSVESFRASCAFSLQQQPEQQQQQQTSADPSSEPTAMAQPEDEVLSQYYTSDPLRVLRNKRREQERAKRRKHAKRKRSHSTSGSSKLKRTSEQQQQEQGEEGNQAHDDQQQQQQQQQHHHHHQDDTAEDATSMYFETPSKYKWRSLYDEDTSEIEASLLQHQVVAHDNDSEHHNNDACEIREPDREHEAQASTDQQHELHAVDEKQVLGISSTLTTTTTTTTTSGSSTTLMRWADLPDDAGDCDEEAGLLPPLPSPTNTATHQATPPPSPKLPTPPPPTTTPPPPTNRLAFVKLLPESIMFGNRAETSTSSTTPTTGTTNSLTNSHSSVETSSTGLRVSATLFVRSPVTSPRKSTSPTTTTTKHYNHHQTTTYSKPTLLFAKPLAQLHFDTTTDDE